MMRRQLQRFGIPALLLACGLLIGMPAGYFFAARHTDVKPPARTNTDVIKLTLPKTFFADLPKSGDGDLRLVSVDTFTNVNLGAVVLPTFPQQPKSVEAGQLPPLRR